MPLTQKILPNYTYADYCHWEGDWEIIAGIPFAMSPSPSPRHQMISANLIYALKQTLYQQTECPCVVYDPVDIKIDEHTVLRPDVLLVCKPIFGLFLDFPPNLVIEVLSPSTRKKDLNLKYQLYADFGIKYYLIADPENNSLFAYFLQGGQYEEMQTPFIFELEQSCSIGPNFSEVFR